MTKDEIKKALKERGVKAIAIAKEANVSRSMVSHVMAGKYPGSPVRDLIARKLGKNKSDIWPPKS